LGLEFRSVRPVRRRGVHSAAGRQLRPRVAPLHDVHPPGPDARPVGIEVVPVRREAPVRERFTS